MTTSASDTNLAGRTLVHFSLLDSCEKKLNLDLTPDDFYKLCLEMEKAKFQLEVLLKNTKAAGGGGNKKQECDNEQKK